MRRVEFGTPIVYISGAVRGKARAERANKEEARMRERGQRRTLEDYIAGGYFGENEKEAWAMPRAWLEKVVHQENGDKFFHEDFEREYFAGATGVKEYR